MYHRTFGTWTLVEEPEHSDIVIPGNSLLRSFMAFVVISVTLFQGKSSGRCCKTLSVTDHTAGHGLSNGSVHREPTALKDSTQRHTFATTAPFFCEQEEGVFYKNVLLFFSHLLTYQSWTSSSTLKAGCSSPKTVQINWALMS